MNFLTATDEFSEIDINLAIFLLQVTNFLKSILIDFTFNFFLITTDKFSIIGFNLAIFNRF